jgi:hypothetical protein
MSPSLTRVVITIAAVLVPAGNTHLRAQAAGPADRIQIIPAPKQAVAGDGAFSLRNARILLGDAKSADDQFAARDFIDDVKATAGVAILIGHKQSRGDILIGLIDQPAVTQALKRMAIEAPPNLNEEGYLIAANTDHVVIAGKTPAGTFYGLQTLKQLVRGDGAGAIIPAVKITDWPTMRWRGVSDDISRGPVPTVDYIKRQIRTEAYFKMNMHSFYMEHTFSSELHPLIGPQGGSLKPAEIKELVAYARNYHVELVPEQQTFGHLHKALRLEKYADLAETPYGDVLSPQQQASYKLIGDWYKELNDLFPGQFFHIGEDETFELGEGQSRAEAQIKGVGAVYFEHLNRVRDLLKPYNRKLMFWGDIALHHPDLIGSIPKDLIVMNWQYGARDEFVTSIKPFQDAGLQQFVCPGAQTWNQIFPNTEAAAKNIINFVRDGQQAGAIGMMNTTWDDDGESLFETAWYPLALGAAASWQQGTLDRSGFDRNFAWSFYRAEGNELLSVNLTLGSAVQIMGSGATDDLFWRDPFTTQFQNQARANADRIKQLRLNAENAEELLLRNANQVRRNRENLAALSLAARRFDHLGRRYEVMQKFSNQYWDAYLNLGDRTKTRKLRNYSGVVYNNLREMAEELSILKEDYRKQWLAENRPYWLESVLSRYDQMISMWLTRSRAMDDALRKYEATSTLPAPDEFGLGPRPLAPAAQR